MRRLISLVLIFLSLLLLTGCWDYREVDQLATVYAIGIDRIPGSNPILLTVQVVAPAVAKGAGGDSGGGGGGQGKPYTIISGEGKSFFDAVSKLGRQLPRQLYFAHTKIIALGKDLAETGIGDVLDALDRNPEIRRTTLILATDRTAHEVLGKSTPLERLPAKGLEMILEKSNRDAFVPSVSLYQFIDQMQGAAGVSFVPLLQLVKNPGSGLDSGTQDNLTISRTAIFKNQRQVGVLDQDESKGLMWLLDQPQGETVVLINGSGAQQRGPIALRILAGQTTITPKVSEDGIMMQISCTGRAAVREAEIPGLDLSDPETVKQLEQQAAEVIKGQIEHTITKAQTELNADFVGFAEHLHENYPTEWKRVKPNWDDIFPTVNYEVTCQVKIVNFNIINNPAQSSNQKE